jgi:hypothetical protein
VNQSIPHEPYIYALFHKVGSANARRRTRDLLAQMEVFVSEEEGHLKVGRSQDCAPDMMDFK